MGKYRFRKMYFQCKDKRVLEPTNQFTNAYRDREYAQSNLDSRKRTTHHMWEDENKPLAVETVEGFYLVPEALFDEILKPHIKPEDDPKTQGT